MKINKKNIIISLTLIILSVYFIKFNSLKSLNKNDLNVLKYIECVDKVSGNKVQINWKYVAAIVGVLSDNKFNKVKDSDIEQISKMFINEHDKKLNNLSDVLSKLKLSNKKIERVYKYIDDLQNHGTKPSRLHKDGEYMKFINNIKESAIYNYKKYKILPSITISQAILESNWGKSILSKGFNNLFGIKADKSWTGEYVTLETKEYSSTVINDKFRKYKDKSESIEDHAKFLVENKRYKENGVFESNTYTYQAKALEKSGYSTVSNENGELIYADMLIELIKQYNLQLIDSEIQSLA